MELHPVKQYAHLFFDLDHTLWDFESNSRATLREQFHTEGLAERGISDADAFIDAYEEINQSLWTRYESGHLHKDVLRVLRFRNTLLMFGIKDEPLAVRMGKEYLAICPSKSALMPGALSLLEDLHGRYKMHIITNGFDEVQGIKLERSGIAGYFDLVLTSEKAGARKPDPRIFATALKRTKAVADHSLMIGDNPIADIEGARSAGWDQAHFSPSVDHDPLATYGLKHLGDLRPILL